MRKITAQPDEIKPQELQQHSVIANVLRHLFSSTQSLCDSGSNYHVAQHGWLFWLSTGWPGCHRSWLSAPAESVRFYCSFYGICCPCYTWLQVLLPPPSCRNKYCSWCCREKLFTYRDKLALLAFFFTLTASLIAVPVSCISWSSTSLNPLSLMHSVGDGNWNMREYVCLLSYDESNFTVLINRQLFMYRIQETR